MPRAKTKKAPKSLYKKIKENLLLLIALSLVFGIAGTALALGIQHKYHYTSNMYEVAACTTNYPGYPAIPQIPCTAIKEGWPAKFVSSDVHVQVGINDPHNPVLVTELFAMGDLHFRPALFLLDWLLWSAIGFGFLVAAIWLKKDSSKPKHR